MTDEKHSAIVAIQCICECINGLNVEMVCGFVQNQYIRFDHSKVCEDCTALLAVGEVLDCGGLGLARDPLVAQVRTDLGFFQIGLFRFQILEGREFPWEMLC